MLSTTIALKKKSAPYKMASNISHGTSDDARRDFNILYHKKKLRLILKNGAKIRSGMQCIAACYLMQALTAIRVGE